MKCYMVKFTCMIDDRTFEVYETFYSDSLGGLAEDICEYQEDLEDSYNDLYVVGKEIWEIEDKKKIFVCRR